MKSHLPKVVGFGLLTWLIPFIVSFFFFRDGEIIVDETYFKSIMVVVSSLVGTILLVQYFKEISKNYLIAGVWVGFIWLGMNWLLDLLMVNRGLFEMTYQEYFQEIGLRYVMIPIISVGMAMMATQALEGNQTDGDTDMIEEKEE